MAFFRYAARAMSHTSPTGIVGVDSVIGWTVVDSQGKRIGTLQDIMLELSTGRLAYAVIRLSGGKGNASLVCVPWNAIHANHEAHQLRINAHIDWIARGPLVRRGYAPDKFVQEWGALIHNYFGTRPYWESASTPQHS
jgi:sporulation protein YlmC with PRC-barrel domain